MAARCFDMHIALCSRTEVSCASYALSEAACVSELAFKVMVLLVGEECVL